MTPQSTTPPTRDQILQQLQEAEVKFLRLQFTDILGTTKNVEVPKSQFAKALNGDVTFDGSAVEGFTRVEESDMLLRPDLGTFLIYPQFSREEGERGKVARLICDVALPDGTPFDGDPRQVLKRQIARAQAMGFEMFVGTEPEFFLF